DPKEQLRRIALYLGVPAFAFFVFLLMWTGAAKSIETKYGALPTPGQVWNEAGQLLAHHYENRESQRAFEAEQAAKAAAFEAKINELRLALEGADPSDQLALNEQLAVLEGRER